MTPKHSFYLFKTGVNTTDDIVELTPYLNKLVLNGKWNFDLEDSDKVLCLTSSISVKENIEVLLEKKGFFIKELHYLDHE